MNDTPHTSPFDAIRHEDEQGNEYWSARDLYKLLGYSRWEKFQKSIEEAQKACKNSGQAISDHFHSKFLLEFAHSLFLPRFIFFLVFIDLFQYTQ